MKFCKVKEDYIKFMNSLDNQVMHNKNGRPYICCLVKINDIEYLVPITSNRKTNKLDLDIKIKRNLNSHDVIGHVKPCKMLPGHPLLYDYIKFQDINDDKSKALLAMKYEYLKTKHIKNKIIEKCEKSYLKQKPTKHFVNFKFLENKMKQYIKEKYELDINKSNLFDKIAQINMINKPKEK